MGKCFTCYLIRNKMQPKEVGMIIPILQRRKWGLSNPAKTRQLVTGFLAPQSSL